MVSVVSKSNHKIIEWIVYFLLILTISNTAQLCFNQTFKFGVIALFLVFDIALKKKNDRIILWILGLWLLINLVYTFVFSAPFGLNQTIGYATPVIMAYLAMVIIGPAFWEKLEKWIYVLTCISLVMFVGNLLLPGVYDSLSSVFGGYIAEFYTDARPSSWYAFVYTYSPIEEIDYMRNAGFMWEAGAYAMTSLIALIYRIGRNGMNFDKKCIVYIIAIVTTFSSAGYLALMLFFAYYFAYKRNFWYTILLAVLIFVGIPYIYQLEFMSEKFADYMSNSNLNAASYNERLEMFEYNRFTVFEINMKRLLEWPVGYGVNEIRDYSGMRFVGVNGLGAFSRMWGVAGLVLLIYGIQRTVRMMNTTIGKGTAFFFLLPVLVMFFSNPIEFSAIPWFFCLTPFIYRKYKNI